jgi:hypothetical protein
MKDSTGYSQDPTAIKVELCSEKKCATCFETGVVCMSNIFRPQQLDFGNASFAKPGKTANQTINK